ncbi:type III PLP-dependent enzyme [Plantactinospora sp. CA-290183]|uniref:type III PLP-dependent enzyme n=1 Tax=Plantactinospora sp. CA-290183 TaxID=3240006 RepID=UPI003D92AD08
MEHDFRARVRRALATDIQNMPALSLVESFGSPLLILEPRNIRRQYQALQRALPMVEHHFAIKALRHSAAVAAVDECDGYFDVMTNSDVDMVKARGIDPGRCIHTNPIKRMRDIVYAFRHGLRTFVVDNYAEADKFVPYAGQVQLLVRLSFRNPEAKSDLSFKFGVPPEEAEKLVSYVRDRGLAVAGFSLHVGSQIHTAQAYVEAIEQATGLIDRVEREQGFRMTMFDIGGGFPVPYLEPAPTLAEIAAGITPLLEPLAQRMRLLSEPGRFVVASSMTLISEVVGKSVRNGRPWYYLDDGVYGSYSNVIFEQVTPPVIAFKELDGDRQLPLTPSVLAGPTCDSVDVITTDCPLPALEIGDLVVSPMMGAYTWVSATEYNGIARTPIRVVSDWDYVEDEMISAAARQPDSIAPSR